MDEDARVQELEQETESQKETIANQKEIIENLCYWIEHVNDAANGSGLTELSRAIDKAMDYTRETSVRNAR